MVACGPGVERVAEEVAERFPQARLALLSSDLIPGLTEMRAMIHQIEAHEIDIIIGTQIVAKGHHFTDLALVGVVDGDLGLAHQTGMLPPYGRLAAIIVSAREKDLAERTARAVVMAAPPSEKISVLGPAEAPIAVVRGRARWRILVKAPRDLDLQSYLRAWSAALPAFKGDVRISLDVDPYSFL